MTRVARWMWKTAFPPVAAFVVFTTLWHVATVQFRIKPYVLPSPLRVWEAACENAGMLWGAACLTGFEALVAFGCSLVGGVVVACLFSQSRAIRTAFFPYAVFLQTVPIVAIAPLIVIWFGYGIHSVILVAIVISLFPIITNATAGLLAVDPDLLDLFRLNNASRAQTLLKLRLPSAVPSIITGARISSGVAVIGAIVGEFFVGYSTQQRGLGSLVMFYKETDPVILFATVIASTLLGLAIFSAVSFLGALILRRWYDVPQDVAR